MGIFAQKGSLETYLLELLGRSQKLSFYASSRGWGFVLTWAHRVAGVMLLLYVFFHVITLSGLNNPASFAAKMDFIDNFLFAFLEWALALPVIFHALNGGRLILYEIFSVRDDKRMIHWVFLLTALYTFSIGLCMVLGDQHVSTGVFWLMVAMASSLTTTMVCRKVWRTRNAVFWKLQRISAAFLLPMVSGHMFFMHLNFKAGHDVDTILVRMSGMGMKIIDFALVVAVFFHAGFGINTIIGDYVEDRRLRTGIKIFSSLVIAAFAYSGAKLIANI